MYERHLWIKLRPGEDPQEWQEHTRAALAVLGDRLWLGRPADAPSARSWDLAVRLTGDSAAALAAGLAHPDVQAWLARVSEHSVVVKAWSFCVA